MLRAYGLFESGQMTMLFGVDPPHVLVEAIVHYNSAVNRTRSDRDEREREKRERKNRMAKLMGG